MGVESQEARSLPRNRKCGNCRFYEPAPLWRKGWCRNPKLYPPHANHLVDATTIDCEGGFRSRIYWEPLPQQEPQNIPQINRVETPQPSQTQTYHVPPRQQAQQPTISMRGVQNPGPINPPPVAPRSEPFGQRPVENSYQQAANEPAQYQRQAEPIYYVEAEVVNEEPQRPAKDWRAVLKRNAPISEKLPLENLKIPQQIPLPWAVAGVLVLVLLVLLIANPGKKNDNQGSNSAAAQTTATVMVQTTSTAQAQLQTATAVTTVAATPTPVKTTKTAVVKGTGAVPLNVRDDASVKAKQIFTVKEGEKVTILDGPVPGDGRGWYKIEYNGKTGWAAKEFLEVQS